MAGSAGTKRGEPHGAVDWRAGAWAGAIAGIVFMMAEMLMVWLFLGQSPWGPPRMIAAMAMGRDVLPPPAAFDTTIVMVAMVIHFVLSIVLGLLGAWLVQRFDRGGGAIAGAVLGLAIYLVNFHVIAPAMFPWFTGAQNWVSVLAHVLFGAVLGAAYVGLRRPAVRRP